MNENKTNKRDSMVFYRSYYEALLNLPAKKRDAATKAIFEYAFNNIEPTNLDPLGNMVFTVAKPLIDHANQRYNSCVSNGKKGGRPKKQPPCDVAENDKNKKPLVSENKNQELSENKNQELFELKNLNDNDNDNDNVNNNVNVNVNVNENINVNDNNNDTENVYVNENTKKEPGEAGYEKTTHGKYNNVLLDGIESARLINEFGFDRYLKCVDFLSRYIKRKPDYKSACHYEDIRGWVQDGYNRELKRNESVQKEMEMQKKHDSLGGIDFEDIFEQV